VAIDPSQMSALASMYENAGALQAQQIGNAYKLGNAQIKNAYKIAQMESKDRRFATEVTREWYRGQLEQARQEMERIGIPQMEINKFVAEKNYEIALNELQYKREALAQEGEQFGKQYQLDVAKYGSELASQPDRYFQARRFQALDAPRLLGQDTSAMLAPNGAPMPQIQTMGALMAGQDPYAAQNRYALQEGQQAGQLPPGYATEQYEAGPYQAGQAAPPPGAAPGQYSVSPYGGTSGTPEQQQVDDRQKQIAQIAKASPPSPYDGLNDQDAATLRLMEQVYKKGGRALPGGELERLGATGRGFLKSAGALLGHDYGDLEQEYLSYRPTQGASWMAG
jgi:FtsZ-binding cell division protein ZapB